MKHINDISNNIHNEQRNEHKLDHVENLLLQEGCKTNRKVLSLKVETFYGLFLMFSSSSSFSSFISLPNG
jgi:hypothetical protein